RPAGEQTAAQVLSGQAGRRRQSERPREQAGQRSPPELERAGSERLHPGQHHGRPQQQHNQNIHQPALPPCTIRPGTRGSLEPIPLSDTAGATTTPAAVNPASTSTITSRVSRPPRITVVNACSTASSTATADLPHRYFGASGTR